MQRKLNILKIYKLKYFTKYLHFFSSVNKNFIKIKYLTLIKELFSFLSGVTVRFYILCVLLLLLLPLLLLLLKASHNRFPSSKEYANNLYIQLKTNNHCIIKFCRRLIRKLQELSDKTEDSNYGILTK